MAVISILISLIVAAIIVYVAITLYTGGSGQEGTIKSPIERGEAVKCAAQIRRIETALQVYRIEHSQYPQVLSDLEELSEDEFYCPVTGSRYDYDQTTGRVTCPDHP
jgi:hypothetical protein